MPAIMAMEGCIGLSMHAADAALRPMREQAGTNLGGSPQVDEWEIAVLHGDHQTSDSTCVRYAWLQTDAGRLDDAIERCRSEVRCCPPPRVWRASAARASWWTGSLGALLPR